MKYFSLSYMLSEKDYSDYEKIVFKGVLLNVHSAALFIGNRIAGGAVCHGGSDADLLDLAKLFNKTLGNKSVAAVGAVCAVIFNGAAHKNQRNVFLFHSVGLTGKTEIKIHSFILSYSV